MNTPRLLVAVLLLASAFAAPHFVRAAESYGNCTGFIDSLPATISTDGTWCLRKDLATGIATGNAIEIAADDVTIDCNGFKLGGLAAGPDSQTTGIHSYNRKNAAIRHCNIRGFVNGIFLYGGSGHLVEDNRLDNNLFVGIDIDDATHNRIRRNAVYDTGGMTAGVYATGIYAYADITDNTVDGLFTSATSTQVSGIQSRGDDNQVSGNRVGGLVLNGGGKAFGIMAYGSHQSVAGNQVSAALGGTNGSGLYGTAYCSGNTVANFMIAIDFCTDDGDNAAL
jgi:parallel beta-helix repeat protein